MAKVTERGAFRFFVEPSDAKASVQIGIEVDVQRLTASREETLHAILLALPKSIQREAKRQIARIQKDDEGDG